MSDFAWNENGLVFNGYTRASVKELEGLLIPNTKASSSSDRPIVHPKAWWDAQVAFHGLKKQSTMEKSKQVLRHALELSTSLTPPPHLAELSKKLQKSWKAQLARNEKQKYSACTTDSAKADMDPKRFLMDHFKTSSSIVFKEHVQRIPLQAAADSLSLQYMSVDAPTRTVNPMHMPRFLIVAKTRDDLIKAADSVQGSIPRPSPAKKQKVDTSKIQKTPAVSKPENHQVGQKQTARKCGMTPAQLAQMHAEDAKAAKKKKTKQAAASISSSAAISNVVANISSTPQSALAAPAALSKAICVFAGEWSIDSSALTNAYGTGPKRFRVQWEESLLFATFQMGTIEGTCLFSGKPKAGKRMEFTWRGNNIHGTQIYVNRHGLYRGHVVFHPAKTLIGDIHTPDGHYGFNGTWIGKVVGESVLPSVTWQYLWNQSGGSDVNHDNDMEYEVNRYSNDQKEEEDSGDQQYDSDGKDKVMFNSMTKRS